MHVSKLEDLERFTTLDGSTIREIVGPVVDAGAQPEPGRGDGARRRRDGGPLPPRGRGAVLLHLRPRPAAHRRTSSATSSPATARSSRQEPFTNCGTSGRTRSCSCAAAPPPTPTRTPCSSKTLDPPRLRRRCAVCTCRCARRSLCVLAVVAAVLASPRRRARSRSASPTTRPTCSSTRASRRRAHATRASRSAGTRCRARGRPRRSTRGWPPRAARASTRSSRFGHSRTDRREPADARALPVRVPPLPRALPVGEGVRRLERGQPLRRADLPPPAARRRLLPQHAPRVPGLPDPRRRGPRHAEHGLVGARVPPPRAGEEPRYWGLHNYIDANRARTTGTRRMLHAVKGQVWFTETGGIVARANRHKVDVPGVGRSTRRPRRASSSTSSSR